MNTSAACFIPNRKQIFSLNAFVVVVVVIVAVFSISLKAYDVMPDALIRLPFVSLTHSLTVSDSLVCFVQNILEIFVLCMFRARNLRTSVNER